MLVLFLFSIYTSVNAFKLATDVCECDCNITAEIERKVAMANITLERTLNNTNNKTKLKFGPVKDMMKELIESVKKMGKKNKFEKDLSMDLRTPAYGPLDSDPIGKTHDDYTTLKKLVRQVPVEDMKSKRLQPKDSLKEYRGRAPATEEQMKAHKASTKNGSDILSDEVLKKIVEFNMSPEAVEEKTNRTVFRKMLDAVKKLKKVKEPELTGHLRSPAPGPRVEL
ncbi:hypothetical protein [Carp edema virus]|nr:hypothetical protein [Carp edema virus]